MRIWTKCEIIDNSEIKDGTMFVTDEECREALQEQILEVLEQNKKMEQLREALEKYGIHKEGCGVECEIDQGLISEYCTCGLSQVLREK